MELNDAQRSALYMTDRMRECIETENWLGLNPYLKYLSSLAFFANIAKERQQPIPFTRYLDA